MTTIVFPIYPGVTQLDFTGPLQVLGNLPEATVVVASVGGQPIAAGGVTFSDLAPLEAVETCDVICIPGGFGCTDAMQDADYMRAVVRLSDGARYVTSVCTGSLILGAAGLLRGRRAACHWAWRHLLANFGAIPDDGRVVRDGNVFTGGGVTAGIDFALTLAAEIAGPVAAQTIQLGLEYAPAPPFNAGRPELAPPEVLAAVQARFAAVEASRTAAVERVAAACQAQRA
jgi:cyclohexyl-isocyanide hydratase